MSNSLSVATVTACLRNLLQNAFDSNPEDKVQNATVTTITPSETRPPGPGANIFLFQVTPNAAFRNTDLPTRSSASDLVGRPRAALDLHYILTFYGDENQLEPQRLLGIAVRTLHVQPVLSPALIEQTIASFSVPPLSFAFLTAANLADAIELVRVTPSAMSADDLARLWSVFAFQTRFSLSLVYQLSVVLIDAAATVAAALPVQIANVFVDVFAPMVIDTVLADPDPTAPIFAGSAVAVRGRGFGVAPHVLVDGVEVTPLGSVSPTVITLTLPATLPAGTHGLQVTLTRDMGTPAVPHVGQQSNLLPFVVRPQVTSVTAENVTTTTVDGQTRLAGDLVVGASPNIGRQQRVAVLLNQFLPSAGDPAGSFAFTVDSRPDTDPPDAPTVTVPFTGLPPGTYLVRLQVDGAGSVLGRDASGRFTTPQVTLP